MNISRNMQMPNMGRSAVFFGQERQNAAKKEPNAANRSAIMAPRQVQIPGAVALTISNEAKKALVQRKEERLAQMEERKTGHIKCDEPYIILKAQNSDLDKMQTRFNLDSEDMEVWRENWRDVATRWGFQASDMMLDFYAQLQTTLGPSRNFMYDFGNMISLANRFSDLRQSLIDRFNNGEICEEELGAKMGELDEAFNLAAEVLSRRAEHREALEDRDNQIGRLQSMRRLLNISGAMRVELACGATVVFLGNSDEDALNTDRVLNTDAHMPLDLLEAIRESTRHFTELTRKFVLENGPVRTQHDIEWLKDTLRQAPPIEDGLTFDELMERSQEL